MEVIDQSLLLEADESDKMRECIIPKAINRFSVFFLPWKFGYEKIKINTVGDENYNKNSRTSFSSVVMENDETLM